MHTPAAIAGRHPMLLLATSPRVPPTIVAFRTDVTALRDHKFQVTLHMRTFCTFCTFVT